MDFKKLNHWLSLCLIAVVLVVGCGGLKAQAPPQIPNPAPPLTAPAPISPTPEPSPQPTPSLEPRTVDLDRLWATLQTLPQQRDQLSGRRLTRNWLQAHLTPLGWQVTEQTFTGGVNLVATWPTATAQQPKIIAAAHYDAVPNSPGFNDNGTGLVALLELAHVFAPGLPSPPPKNLELVFFDLEEQGLQGSFAYTQSWENLQNLEAVMVLDMLGYGCWEPGCQTYPPNLPQAFLPSDRGNFLAAVGDAEHEELLTAFSQLPRSPEFFVYPLSIPLKGMLTPDVLRSDHAPFWLHNVGAVLLTDTGNLRNPHYHQPSDDLVTLNRDFLGRSMEAIATVLSQWLQGV